MACICETAGITWMRVGDELRCPACSNRPEDVRSSCKKCGAEILVGDIERSRDHTCKACWVERERASGKCECWYVDKQVLAVVGGRGLCKKCWRVVLERVPLA